MAKVTFGPTITQATNKIGDTVFTRSRGGNVAKALSLAGIPVKGHNLLSPTHPDTTPATPPTRGDVITAQGTPTTWARLPLGPPGQVLGSNGVDVAWQPGGTGAVTSVGLSMPANFTVTGSPVTTAGTLTATWTTTPKNTLLAGPITGDDATPTFRNLDPADVPNLDTAKITTGTFGPARGGTNNAYTQFTGPASTVKTYTLPNASCNILTDNAPVTIAQGGTSNTTKAAAFNALAPTTTEGDLILYTSDANARLAIGTDGQILASNGTDPVWTTPYAPTDPAVITSPASIHAAILKPSSNLSPPTTNTAYFLPFTIQGSPTIKRILHILTSTAGGNYDVGIYKEDGTRLSSLGTTAVPASAQCIASTIPTITLTPGRYYIAIAYSNNSCTCLASNPATGANQALGVKQMANALPLPNPATFAESTTTNWIPTLSATQETA